jgi:hypothetical protein
VSGVPVAVGEPGATDGVQLGAITPNPAAGRMSLTLQLPMARTVDFSVYDVAGRLTWGSSRLLNPGRHDLEWDGHTLEGAPASAGVYLARVKAGAFEESRRFVFLP